jgi:hypothetical protein
MLKSVCANSFLLYALLLLGSFSCQLGTKNPIDPETEKLQREVDSLRHIKESLQDELQTTKDEDETPTVNPPITPTNTDDSEGISLKVVSAKKNFDANFNPELRITFRNTAAKKVVSAIIAVDFSFNSTEISPNCHFEKTLPLNLASETTQTLNIPIPDAYGKNCADKAWVVVKKITYADGTKE